MIEYSLLDGANKIEDYVDEVVRHKQTAAAITDHGNMHGALHFHNACRDNGIKPIIGCEVYTAQVSMRRKATKANKTNHLTLLAETNEGLKNLYYLSSIAFIEGKSTKPRIDEYVLEGHSKGIICLSGCLSGLINEHLRNDDYEAAREQVAAFMDIFGKDNFWMELQRNGIALQDKVNTGLICLGKEFDLPVVGTNDIHFTRKEDCDFHDTLLCQPGGTMVLKVVKQGKGGHQAEHEYVNIAHIEAGDRVVSWDGSRRRGYLRANGKEVTAVGVRKYQGDTVVVKIEDKRSEYTKDHICIARLDAMKNKYGVYVMKRNGKYRIGITKVNHKANVGSNFGPIKRAREQDADAIWVLKLYDTRKDALLQEALIGYKFNIPTLAFLNPSVVQRGSTNPIELAKFWELIDNNEEDAKKCLNHFGRKIEYPIWTKSFERYGLRRPVKVRACNLMEGMLMCDYEHAISKEHYNNGCTNDGTGCWKPIRLAYNRCNSLVYSIEVADDATYIADGIVTHNCVSTKNLKSEPNRFRFDTDDVYAKSTAEMTAMFSDLPEAVRETQVIAERIDAEIEQGNWIFPKFDSGEKTHIEYLTDLVHERLPALYEDQEAAKKRADYELGVIGSMGYSSYFLTVKDFVDYARTQDIPVGPGRGSAAGSIVSFILGITAVDPIKHKLLFERFLNPDRASCPDIDIDFCKDRRNEIIDYLQDKHGIDRVANICTIGRFGARSAVRRTAKAFGVSLSDADWLAKSCAEGASLKEAIAKEPKLQAAVKNHPKVFEAAMRLEDIASSVGVHASGFVIADRPLYEIVPLTRGKDWQILTQWDGEYCEKAGLVKMDLLGLKTLTVIATCLRHIKKRHNVNLELESLKLNDRKTLGIFRRADTEGIFQCFSEGMKGLMKQIKPTRFEHIVAALSLYRPGPIKSGILASFVKRKNGREDIDYPHKKMRPYLEETYGLMVYQEQIMWAAQILAGFTAAEADTLRKAMGKKKPEIMKSLKQKWLNGVKNTKKITEEKGFSLWEEINLFAEYAFCASHAVSYAYIAYWTAYLKAYYPVEFYAANMTVEGTDKNKDKLRAFIEDAREHKIKVLPPDIRDCSWDFQPVSDNTIRLGIGGIAGIGPGPTKMLVDAKISGDNLLDIFKDLDGKVAKKGAIEALIKAGALDFLDKSRAALYASVPALVKQLQKYRTAKKNGKEPKLTYPEIDESIVWSEHEQLIAERDVYNFFLSGHPLDKKAFEVSIVRNMLIKNIALVTEDVKDVKLVGIISGITVGTVKSGKNKGLKYARVIFEDNTGSTNIMVFSSLYKDISLTLTEKYKNATPVIMQGRIDSKDETPHLVLYSFRPLDEHVTTKKELLIPLYTDGNISVLSRIIEQMKLHPGKLPVKFRVTDFRGRTAYLETNFKVSLNSSLKKSLTELMT